jgi:hypothetical protein
MSLASMPDACAKLTGRGAASAEPSSDPPPPPTPVTSATTPPVWTPPDTATPPTPGSTSTPPKDPDFLKAKELAQKGEHKKVRALLEKKVRSGKATSEELELLSESCTALKDKACVDLVKSKQ